MKFIIAVVILGTVATASVAPILEVASRSTILNSPIISSQGTPSAFSTRQYLATEDAITFASHDQITPLESLPLSYASPLAYSGHFAAPLAYSSYAAPLARALPLGIQADGQYIADPRGAINTAILSGHIDSAASLNLDTVQETL